MAITHLFTFILILGLPFFANSKPVPSPNLAPSAAIAGPTDAEILHIFVTSNNIAVDMATMAEKQSKNKEIQALAKSLASEHNDWNKQVTDYAKKSGRRPTPGLNSTGLNNQAREDINRLKSLDGKSFDQAYLTTTLAFHEKAAAQMDENLLSNVKDSEVKGILLKARPLLGLQVVRIKKAQMDYSKQ